MTEWNVNKVADWLRDRGSYSAWLTELVRACLQSLSPQESDSLMDRLRAIAELDHCVDIDEWLHAAQRLAPHDSSRGGTISDDELGRIRDNIRCRQKDIYPWRDDLSESRRTYLEGEDFDFPKRTSED